MGTAAGAATSARERRWRPCDGRPNFTQEYADLELASRGLVSSGPTYATVQAAGESAVRCRLEQLAAQFVSPATGMTVDPK
jgi:hypothetical protein